MKKIDRLILKSFIGPLVLTFAISVFVLLMQFVWKYIDDMVGKGLEFGVIAELLLYASATFVPMALPIAVLFASIMTMGNFGEKYELVAMKAGGISIRRVMMPLVFVSVLLTGVAFYFSNNVMPLAMLKYKSTLYDITRKKPAVNIRPSEYYDEIEGYVIRVDEKDPDGRTLHNITIYDHNDGIDNTNIIVAKSGLMQSSPDDRYLLFTLSDGYTYSEPCTGEDYVNRPFTRIGFDEQVLTFDISSFAFEKTDEEFAALLKDNRPSSGLWGVVRPEKAQDENKLLPGLENMKISMFKLFSDKNFDFSFVGRVGSEKDAEALKQNLQNLLDMAKAGVVNEKEATELLKAVEVKSTADSASMVLSVPAETMKAFLVRLATPANK